MVRDAGVARRLVDGRAGLDVLVVIGQVVQLERATRGEQGAQKDDGPPEERDKSRAGAHGHRIGGRSAVQERRRFWWKSWK